MKAPTSQAIPDQLLQAIADNFAYLVIDQTGQRYWRPGLISFDLTRQRMQMDTTFFAALKRAKGKTFTLDKSLSGTSIREQTEAGQLFYAWVWGHSMGLAPIEYEFSPESELLSNLLRQLGLSAYRFDPADPLHVAQGSMALQGDLIDGFGHRVFELIQRPGTKEAIKQHRDDIRSAIAKSERYIGRLEHNHAVLAISRFELHYRIGPDTPRPTLRENARHVDDLATALDEMQASGMIAGYWWARRCLAEHGYGLHLTVFSDAHQSSSSLAHVSAAIPDAWNTTTEGLGYACELNNFDANHRAWGAHSINFAGRIDSPLARTLASLRLILESERYLRLKPDPKIAHLGMGEMPAARKDHAVNLPLLVTPSLNSTATIQILPTDVVPLTLTYFV